MHTHWDCGPDRHARAKHDSAVGCLLERDRAAAAVEDTPIGDVRELGRDGARAEVEATVLLDREVDAAAEVASKHEITTVEDHTTKVFCDAEFGASPEVRGDERVCGKVGVAVGPEHKRAGVIDRDGGRVEVAARPEVVDDKRPGVDDDGPGESSAGASCRERAGAIIRDRAVTRDRAGITDGTGAVERELAATGESKIASQRPVSDGQTAAVHRSIPGDTAVEDVERGPKLDRDVASERTSCIGSADLEWSPRDRRAASAAVSQSQREPAGARLRQIRSTGE